MSVSSYSGNCTTDFQSVDFNLLRRTGPIASLLSATLLFGFVCGCGGDGASTGASTYSDHDVPASSGFSDTSSTPVPRSMDELTFNKPAAPHAGVSDFTPPAAGEVYSSSPTEHGSTEVAGSVVSPAPETAPVADVHREKEFVPRSSYQSGLLTAGSFDDVANYHE